MNLEAIKSLVKERRYVDALAACERLTAIQPELKYEVMRQKSYIYAARSEYKAAIKELSFIINDGKADIGCYNSAAFWALFDEQYEQALGWYLIALKLGEKQDDTWYRSNELFLTAYVYLRLGKYEEAISYLDKLEPDDKNSSFLIPMPNEGLVGDCKVKQLRDEINSRMIEKNS
jgi:tetratricopeptide (TPR) repeat protein